MIDYHPEIFTSGKVIMAPLTEAIEKLRQSVIAGDEAHAKVVALYQTMVDRRDHDIKAMMTCLELIALDEFQYPEHEAAQCLKNLGLWNK